MIWRLEEMSEEGFEGTVLGTLIMPYCSGVGNLIFAFLLGKNHGPGGEVMINALVNNVTNLSLLIGLPILIWGYSKPKKSGKSRGSRKNLELDRLSMLLTLTAVLFFTGALWVLGHDGSLSFDDGLVLVGLFVFWQCFHIFDVLKSNVRQSRSFDWMLPVNLAVLAMGAYAVYVSIDWLVAWVSSIEAGPVSAKYLGWLSGALMVLPNAALALYYGWRRRPEVLYSSQVGDAHICIPLCVGIYALFQPLQLPAFFQSGVMLLGGVTLVHLMFIGVWRKLPREMGWVLVAAFFVFVYKGLPR